MALYIVSTPIGNPDDITLRAIDTLKKVDFVICEEFKIGSRLLKRLEIQKDLYSINEHNEKENCDEILSLLKEGKEAALVSDCGTPLFADPGTVLVSRCHQSQIPVVPVPGASSLLASMVVCGYNFNKFHYVGFLPRKTEERREEIRRFKNFTCPIIIYETPYRLLPLLQDLAKELPKGIQGTFSFSLTQSGENIVQGSLEKLLDRFTKKPVKQEFVFILDAPKEPPVKKKAPAQTRKRRH